MFFFLYFKKVDTLVELVLNFETVLNGILNIQVCSNDISNISVNE